MRRYETSIVTAEIYLIGLERRMMERIMMTHSVSEEGLLDVTRPPVIPPAGRLSLSFLTASQSISQEYLGSILDAEVAPSTRSRAHLEQTTGRKEVARVKLISKMIS